MKLKYREVSEYRQVQLQHQDQRCALCGETIELDAVLDHDHKTGKIRRVLHRGCNAFLGKIENNRARNHISDSRLASIAANLVKYINTEHTDILHPTHKEKTMAGRGRGRKKPPKR